jgi:hypothetical protein
VRPWHRTATVQAPEFPLYLLGAERLHGLGASGPQAVAVASQAAGKITTSLLTSSASSGGGAATGVAAWAGPIGVGIAVIGSIIGGLWAAHSARAKGAKNENAAMNSAVQAFDASIKAIFDAANSNDPNKYIDANTAIQALQQTLQSYWTAMAQYSTAPGTADQSHGGTNCAAVWAKPTACDKACTAGCCAGCVDLTPSISDAIAVFQQGGGTVNVRKVFGSKYGGSERAAYTLTYKPNPPTAPASVDALAQALTGGSTGGGGGSFLLPLVGIGLALFLMH